MDLMQCRDEIDKLDKELFEILAKRFKIVEEVIEYKIQNKFSIYQKAREDEVITKIQDYAEGLGMDKYFAKDLIKMVMTQSKVIQEKVLNERD